MPRKVHEGIVILARVWSTGAFWSIAGVGFCNWYLARDHKSCDTMDMRTISQIPLPELFILLPILDIHWSRRGVLENTARYVFFTTYGVERNSNSCLYESDMPPSQSGACLLRIPAIRVSVAIQITAIHSLKCCLFLYAMFLHTPLSFILCPRRIRCMCIHI